MDIVKDVLEYYYLERYPYLITYPLSYPLSYPWTYSIERTSQDKSAYVWIERRQQSPDARTPQCVPAVQGSNWQSTVSRLMSSANYAVINTIRK
jgi:hypothetical protein